MGMATLQFYKNKYNYPNFSPTLTAYGSSLPSTPVGISLKNGKLRVRGNMNDFMSCNYVGITRDGKTIYAWIDDVEFHTDNSFYVSYTVDAWRTYKDKIILGTQYIERSPVETNKFDGLLGSLKETNEVYRWQQTIGTSSKRYAVVQFRYGYETNTPVQPTPYSFYFCEYSVNDWKSTGALTELMSYLRDNPENNRIVTLYSIPYVNMVNMVKTGLPVQDNLVIPGWYELEGTQNSMEGKLTTVTTINNFPEGLTRVNHNVMMVIPEAGIINIPDELIGIGPLQLRQDIDLFSGACNYMITTLNGTEPFHLSVRGSSISSIPIISNPYDTYISQNQNALATSLIGDVASIGMGAVTSTTNPAIGGGMLANGVRGIASTLGGIEDASKKGFSNPPSFLGTALASSFHQTFWIVIYKTKVDNAVNVNENFGYPYNMVNTLTFPLSGFIQTRECNIHSIDGSVPRWAIEEINKNFDNGILVKTS